ncbi:glycoside hydrolase family 3 N-terminal domain-containing protein [Spirochaeta thermophila]|uniref:Glycoside hydrolase family 3 n=1 Tax=Winmispira thermophila (strain ATCC 49972 / DSM 6192 / RI 19.B1) TaxID=665571 RepID=E0RUB3_WINT6|nr:glycoside hydrolase family 3 N-terminal domain-containing protein [Spirochaeta thermophila]ADN02334.1 glycoside hydrolase family 3 [Spirochaeta thermophila DSM 6192]
MNGNERMTSLLSRMSIEEKAGLMVHRAKGVPRLGIPNYNWWNEALHGVANSGEATVFPQAIGLAATFDPDLVRRVADAISREARAKFNAVGKERAAEYERGLTFWSPNINIYRDPRWGRGQETYGEDPFLTSKIGVAFVKGLQGDHPYYLRVAACAKHYAVHSGPEGLRHVFDARVSEKDLWETYLPAFEALVKAGVEAVMGAYNRVNGEPACGSKRLLEEILRKKWGFKGHVVSDCWAIADFHLHHKVTKDPIESIAMALEAGCDLNCGNTYEHLLDAVKAGAVSEELVDRSVARLLSTLDRLGLFTDDHPYVRLSLADIDWEAHRALAREAAEKSVVLLKNNGILPLDRRKLRYIYVTGPNAANPVALLGNYAGVSSRLVTVLEGITGYAGPGITVTYKIGCPLQGNKINPIDWASGVARYADVTVAVMGRDSAVEGEEGDAIFSDNYGDLSDLNLSREQIDYLRRIKEIGKPLVVVLLSGAPVCSPELEELADAIVYAWYPGEEGGNAIARVLFGEVSPSGRLPITFPKGVDQLPPFTDYSMEGRTYRYMKEEPLYPFGFGLSYATFSYRDPKSSASRWDKRETLEVVCEVENTSSIPADEVVQLYVRWEDAPFRVPLWSLKGFTRVSLGTGERIQVRFVLSPEDLSFIDEKGRKVLPEGRLRFHVGPASPGGRAQELGSPEGVEIVVEC